MFHKNAISGVRNYIFSLILYIFITRDLQNYSTFLYANSLSWYYLSKKNNPEKLKIYPFKSHSSLCNAMFL